MLSSRIIVLWMLSVFLAAFSARAQDTQFLPEVDAHLKVNSYLRTYLQAKDDREGGDPAQFTFGPSIQLYLKPLIRVSLDHRRHSGFGCSTTTAGLD